MQHPDPKHPVDNVVTFQDLVPRPGRIGRALQDTVCFHRTLILTAKELPGHAPIAFPTEKAAEGWLARTRKVPHAALNEINNGVRGFDLHAAKIRRAVVQARTCLVLIQAEECPRDVIEAAHGALTEYTPLPNLDPTIVRGSKSD